MTALTTMSPDLPPPTEDGRIGYREAIAAFQDVARAAAVPSARLEDLLRLTGQHLCQLLGVSRSSVYLRRSDGRFQGKVAYCTSRPNIDSTAIRRVTGHDRFTAEIVSSAAPIAVADASRDTRTVQRAMRHWQVKDVVGVPLVVDNQVIGIIYADDAGKQHTFAPADMEMAQTFSNLTAYVIKQVCQRQRASKLAHEAEQGRRALERVAVVREAVTTLLSSGAALTDVLQTVADLTGKPVVRYGRGLNPLGWAFPAGTPRQFTDASPALQSADLLHADVAHALARFGAGATHVVLRNTPERRSRRLLVRLARRGMERGYLELCEMGGAFQPSDPKVMEEVAAAVILKFSVESMVGPSISGADNFLEDLLCGRYDEDALRSRAPESGVDPDKRHIIGRLGRLGRPGNQEHELTLELAEVLAEFAGSLDKRIRPVGEVCDGQHLVALLEISGDLGRSDAREVIAAAWSLLSERPTAVRGAFSDVTSTLSELVVADSRLSEVTDLLDQHSSHGEPLVFAADFELLRLTSGIGGVRGAAQAARQVLRPLIEYDRENGGNLLSTLRAFIDCGAQFRVTAGCLGVHENTVRYRLNRIAEIASIDPGNFQDLSRAAFALQVERLGSPLGLGDATRVMAFGSLSSGPIEVACGI